MNVRRASAAILIFLLASIQFARADSVDDYIKSEMSKQQIPGLSLAVLWKGKPIKVKSYGVADVDQKTPVTAETAYDVGSVAKPFTAAAILMLAETGKIRLDDPITRFFSNVPAQWRGVTVWHLLTNTSGIKDYTTEIPTTANLIFTEDLIFNRAVGGGINFPPGTQFRYSQTNYVLLGMIIRSATGRPFYDFITNRIFKPLEMTHTVPYAVTKSPADLATGYRLVNGQRAPVERERREFGDAFFSSTINDMVKWAVALENGAILSDQASALMWNPAPLQSTARVRRPVQSREPAHAPGATATARKGAHGRPAAPPKGDADSPVVTVKSASGSPVPAEDSAPEQPAPEVKTAPYGAGWYNEELKGHRVIGHGGSVGGFSANLTRFPDDKLTVIILTNLRDVKVFPLIRGVASSYAPALK